MPTVAVRLLELFHDLVPADGVPEVLLVPTGPGNASQGAQAAVPPATAGA